MMTTSCKRSRRGRAAAAVVITRVDKGYPAASAGLQAGDVLLSVDGLEVHTVEQAANARRGLVRHSARALPGASTHWVDGSELEVDDELNVTRVSQRHETDAPTGQLVVQANGRLLR